MGMCVASPREEETAGLKGAGRVRGSSVPRDPGICQGRNRTATVLGLVTPHSCPQSGSLPRGQPTAAFEGEGEGQQNHPET